MAIFEIIEGAPGMGKSLYTAKRTKKIFIKNRNYFKKSGIIRPIYSNLKFSESFEKLCGYGTEQSFLYYWSDTRELCALRDCDIIWDEIATELDSRDYANLSMELKRLLSQYRKRGIDIYANTQDFSMIDRRARLMVTGVSTLTKLLGSRDISATKPVLKYVWGVIMIRVVLNYKEDKPEKKEYEFLPSFFLIERELIELYDTRQDIPMGKKAPLHHIILECEESTCNFHKIDHK